MRVGIVINPVSGRRGRVASAGTDRVALVERFADRRQGVEIEAVLTTAPGHGAELARGFVARQFDLVVAWGGDGTANEVAGPLIGTRTALGIVSQGSGEGLARGLGLPAAFDAALAAALERPGELIDIGYLAGRHFLNVAGIGFDAEVAHAFNAAGSRRGVLEYVRRAAGQVWSYRASTYEVTLDDRRADGAYLMIAFANGREFGNRMVIAADADFRDGWLDAVLVDDGAAWQQLWRARRLTFGMHRPARGIHRSRIRAATIAAPRMACHVDGEPFEASGRIDMRTEPGALRIAGIGATARR